MQLEMYRCYACRKLVLNKHILKNGGCVCGSLKVMGASPSNLIEHIVVLWWTLTER